MERGAQIADLAGTHHIVERVQRLFKRCVVVEAVEPGRGRYSRAKTTQAGIHSLEDVLPRQTAIIRIVGHRIVELGGQHQFVAGAIGQCPADDFLTGASRIHVRRVEKIDSESNGPVYDRIRTFPIKHPGRPIRRTKGHATKCQLRHFEARSTEIDIIHVETRCASFIFLSIAFLRRVDRLRCTRARTH